MPRTKVDTIVLIRNSYFGEADTTFWCLMGRTLIIKKREKGIKQMISITDIQRSRMEHRLEMGPDDSSRSVAPILAIFLVAAPTESEAIFVDNNSVFEPKQVQPSRTFSFHLCSVTRSFTSLYV